MAPDRVSFRKICLHQQLTFCFYHNRKLNLEIRVKNIVNNKNLHSALVRFQNCFYAVCQTKKFSITTPSSFVLRRTFSIGFLEERKYKCGLPGLPYKHPVCRTNNQVAFIVDFAWASGLLRKFLVSHNQNGGCQLEKIRINSFTQIEFPRNKPISSYYVENHLPSEICFGKTNV